MTPSAKQLGFLIGTKTLVFLLLLVLILAGAVLIASCVIAPKDSFYLGAASIIASIGMFFFTLAAQFLITLSMQETVDVFDSRLAFTFMVGYAAYAFAILFLVFHVLAR